jgi:hypothetical protein
VAANVVTIFLILIVTINTNLGAFSTLGMQNSKISLLLPEYVSKSLESDKFNLTELKI